MRYPMTEERSMAQFFMTRLVRARRLHSITQWIAIAVLATDVAWGATLTWSPNTEPDLAGYRVYQCTSQPCGRAHGTAALLVTLGTVTSFNIGTPGSIHYYVITAYDTANNESAESGTVIYSPPNSSPPPPPPPWFAAAEFPLTGSQISYFRSDRYNVLHSSADKPIQTKRTIF